MPSGYTGPTTSIPITTTLPDTTFDGPAFWSQSAYQLPSGSPMTVLGWTGTDSAHHLNVETSNDGLNYQNKTTLNETSFTRPSVMAMPAGSGSAVVIAWAGTDAAHHLNVIYDVYGSPQKVTLAERSVYPPSLAYFAGQVWIAWTGNDPNQSLNVLALGAQGLTPGAKTIFGSDSSTATPDLVPDTVDNRLLLTWQMRTTRQLNFVESPDGVNWSPGLSAPSPQTSFVSPDDDGHQSGSAWRIDHATVLLVLDWNRHCPVDERHGLWFGQQLVRSRQYATGNQPFPAATWLCWHGTCDSGSVDWHRSR